MMSARIGLEVRADDLRAVMIRSGKIAWHTRVTLHDSSPLADSVAMLLAQRPSVGRGRPRVSAAVGFSHAQIKRLDGLPQVRERVQMTRLLREHASAVFLADAGTVAVPDVFRSADAKWWGAAIDRAVIDDVVVGARRSGLRVEAIVPTASALARTCPDGSQTVDDGRASIAIVTKGGELRELRRSTVSSNASTTPEPLHSLGDEASAYAGAYAAAISSKRLPLTWKVEAADATAATVRRMRVSAMAALVGVVGSLALLAPGLHSSLIVRRAQQSSIGSMDWRNDMARTESDLRRTTQLLTSVARFDASRGAVMRLVAQLGQSLPESTAIVSLRVDSVEGSFIAVAPHVTDVLGELGSVDRIQNARIVGGVTREAIAGARVERATFRFLRTRPSESARSGATARPGSARQ
jgi:hypothetical protein